MPIKILYDESLEWKTVFSYSPTMEILLSLHVLCNAQHHALHLQWAVQTKRRMDRRMLADLRYFGRGFRQYLILCDLITLEPDSDLKSFEEEMQELASLSDLGFAHRILREFCTEEEVASALEEGNAREGILTRFQEEPANPRNTRTGLAGYSVSAQRQAVRELLGNTQAFRERLMGFLGRYWEDIFAVEFQRLEPWFLADITEKARMLRSSGALAFLSQISHRIVAHQEERELLIYKQVDATIRGASLESVTITPTYFGSPHLILSIEPEHFILCYDLTASGSGTRPEIPPSRLISLLRALGDEVRLTILKLIAEKRRSTQELAQILGITPPSVSRHLRILKDAGLLTSEGEGYYVFYSLVPEELPALGRHLTDFLDFHRPKSGSAAHLLSPPR